MLRLIGLILLVLLLICVVSAIVESGEEDPCEGCVQKDEPRYTKAGLGCEHCPFRRDRKNDE